MIVVQDEPQATDFERKLPSEDADIEAIRDGILTLQARAAAQGKRPLARGTHTKGTAVRAEFEVLDLMGTYTDPALARRLARGIFAKPGIYPAVVRFANGNPGNKPDTSPDVRALSFCIDIPPDATRYGVTRLDFSMNNATTFTWNDAHAFAVFTTVVAAAQQGGWQGLRATARVLSRMSFADLRLLAQTTWRTIRQVRSSPFKPYQQQRYWSTVPFLHGAGEAIKYSAMPEADNPARPLGLSPSCLQDELVRHVNEDEQASTFDFALQLLDPARMTHRGRRQEASFWIENASVEWKEDEAPFHVVGRLRLQPRSVLSPEETAALNFHVGQRSTPESRPLGSINRARRIGEDASWKARAAQREVLTPWTAANPAWPVIWGTLGTLALVGAATGRQVTILGNQIGNSVTWAALGVAALALAPISRRAVRGVAGLAALVFAVVHRKALWTGISITAVALSTTLGRGLAPVGQEVPEPLTYPQRPVNWTAGNGLTPVEREQLYHLSQGSVILPVSLLLALEQEGTPSDGQRTYRPFLDNIERFGLLADPVGDFNPYGLPVGLTVDTNRLNGLQMVGMNCAMCHVAELHFQGKAFRIDGGPSLGQINLFLKGFAAELDATIKDAERRRRFVDRYARVRLRPLPRFPAVGAGAEGDDPRTGPDPTNEGPLGRVLHALQYSVGNSTAASSLRAAGAGPALLNLLKPEFLIGTEDGFGRNDAFAAGRNELFGLYQGHGFPAGLNAAAPTAPVSYPHTWGMRYTEWFQWGANTNSVLARNVGEALGTGAQFDAAHEYTSTLRLANLSALEWLQYQLTPPRYPEDLFGPIDRDKAARGKVIFDQTCALCHETYQKVGDLNEYKLLALDDVGTDPGTATGFERNVMTDQGPQQFGLAAFAVIERVTSAYYREHQTPDSLRATWEDRARRPDPQFRQPLRQYDQYPDTRDHGVYRAKTLTGIWATAPYLHNGSVPTIYDLLLPAEQRPKSFTVGSREYDPKKLGYVYRPDGDAPQAPPGMSSFTLDTHTLGNYNTGHEWWFYPKLTDDNRYEIIEFLKTLTGKTYCREGDEADCRPYPLDPARQLPKVIKMEPAHVKGQ